MSKRYTLLFKTFKNALVFKPYYLTGMLLNSTVLLIGESGVGKDMVVTQIHQHSRRKGHQLVCRKCDGAVAAVQLAGQCP